MFQSHLLCYRRHLLPRHSFSFSEIAKQLQDTLKISDSHLRFIIGRSRIRINNLRKTTGCRIITSSEQIEFSGTTEQIEKAKTEVENIVKKVIEFPCPENEFHLSTQIELLRKLSRETKTEIIAEGKNFFIYGETEEQRMAATKSLNEIEKSLKYIHLGNKIGLVMGKEAKHLDKIRKSSACFIHVDRRAQNALLYGNEKQIKAAARYIENVLSENREIIDPKTHHVQKNVSKNSKNNNNSSKNKNKISSTDNGDKNFKKNNDNNKSTKGIVEKKTKVSVVAVVSGGVTSLKPLQANTNLKSSSTQKELTENQKKEDQKWMNNRERKAARRENTQKKEWNEPPPNNKNIESIHCLKFDGSEIFDELHSSEGKEMLASLESRCNVMCKLDGKFVNFFGSEIKVSDAGKMFEKKIKDLKINQEGTQFTNILQTLFAEQPTGIREDQLVSQISEHFSNKNYSKQDICHSIIRRYQHICRVHYWSENVRIYYPVMYAGGSIYIPTEENIRSIIERFGAQGIYLSKLQEHFWNEFHWRIPVDFYTLVSSSSVIEITPTTDELDWILKIKPGYSLKAEAALDHIRNVIKTKTIESTVELTAVEIEPTEKQKQMQQKSAWLEQKEKKKEEFIEKKKKDKLKKEKEKFAKIKLVYTLKREQEKTNKSGSWVERLSDYLKSKPKGVNEKIFVQNYLSRDSYFAHRSVPYSFRYLIRRCQDVVQIETHQNGSRTYFFRGDVSALEKYEEDLEPILPELFKEKNEILLSQMQDRLIETTGKYKAPVNWLNLLRQYRSIKITPTDNIDFKVNYDPNRKIIERD